MSEREWGHVEVEVRSVTVVVVASARILVIDWSCWHQCRCQCAFTYSNTSRRTAVKATTTSLLHCPEQPLLLYQAKHRQEEEDW